MSNPVSSDPPGGGDKGDGGDSPGDSSLLFFVALGFGVVFTNLWYVSSPAITTTTHVFMHCHRGNEHPSHLQLQDHRWRKILLPLQPTKQTAPERRKRRGSRYDQRPETAS